MEDQLKSLKRKRKELLRKKQARKNTEKKTNLLTSNPSKCRVFDFEEDGIGNGSEGIESDYGSANSMDPELYRATMKGNILEFVQAVEKVPADRPLDLPATCIQISPQRNTALHIAASHRHHEIVSIICKDLPFFIPEKNSRGETALHIAARSGDSSLVRLIVNAIKDGDPKAVLGDKNEKGNTALHEALRHRHENVARILIDGNREMAYCVNEEGKSVLYLAAKAGFVELVKLIMDNPVGIINNGDDDQNLKSMSPVHAAIHGRNIDVLRMMWEKDQFSFHLRCEQGRNPLHCAASIGHLEGVNFLLEKLCGAAYQRDRNGHYPIHTASYKGHIDIIHEFLCQCPDSRELLNRQGQNILHVAAMKGNTKLVKFMLRRQTLGRLVNERDTDGNTPLHLAAINKHPKIVACLAEDKRVDLKLKNKEGFTSFDIANYVNLEMTESFRKQLTWLAMRHACAQRSQRKLFKSSVKLGGGGKSKMQNQSREMASMILLLSTFVATVTFSAGFTVPGGDNNSNPNPGIATLVMNKMFHTFVISNTLSLYSSVIVAVTLIGAQSVDASLMPSALKLALPFLALALIAMSVAFMAGMHLVVSNLAWLRNVVFFMGLVFFLTLSSILFVLCVATSNYYMFRYISYYPFRFLLFVFGSYDDEEEEESEISTQKY